LASNLQRIWMVALVLTYVGVFPFFGRLRHANEMPRIGLAKQIVERGTFDLDALVEEKFFLSDVDLSHTPDGHAYSNKAPGVSFIGVPIYASTRFFGEPSLRVTTWCLRMFVVTLPALLFLFWFRRQLHLFADDENAVNTAFVAYGLASPVLPYALQFMSHALTAAAAATTFLLCVRLVRARPTKPERTALLAGFFASACVMLEYQGFIAILVIAIYLLRSSPARWKDALFFVLGGIPLATLLGWYHTVSFGAPWKTGYSFHSEVFEEGVFGTIGPNRKAMFHTLVSPANGMLMLSPWVILAGLGAVTIFSNRDTRSRLGAEAAVCSAIVIGYVLYVGSLVPWFARGGWTVGPRHLLAAYPFIALLAAAGFQSVAKGLPNKPWTASAGWIASRTLVVFSAIVFVVATTTYPHWPEGLKNPLHEVSFRLLGDNHAVHSIATAMGMHGFASLLPEYTSVAIVVLVLLGTHRSTTRRQTFTAMALCALLATGCVWRYQDFPASRSYAQKAYNYVVSTLEP